MRAFNTLLVFTLFSFQINFSQESIVIPEPEFNSRPYYLSNGELISLERADATADIRVKGLGWGGSEFFHMAFGAKSTTRFNNGDFPRIFIKVEGNLDLKELITILKEDTSKKKKKKFRNRRRFKQMSYAMGGRARDVSDNEVPFSVKKIRENLYEIVFDNVLLSGEYAVMPISTENGDILSMAYSKTKISCFGID